MINKLKYLFFTILCAGIVWINVAAQTADEETIAVSDSKLTAIGLPAGARRIKDRSVPAEIRETLGKLIAAGGETVRQGGSEVIVWEGNYAKASGSQMIKKLESALQNSGWEYEVGERNSEFVMFSIFRTAPDRRALMGFFVPSSEVFVFALTEMVRADAPPLEAENRTPQETPQISEASNNGNLNIYGKWFRTVGGGFRDYTGKTKYNAGENFYFEFFPDGTVEYTREKDVLSIMQCKIHERQNARGKFSISGNTLTVNLGAMSSVGSDSCDAKGNFKKTLEPSTIAVSFEVKKMESLARPDNPAILCFDGSDDNCYERTTK